MTRRERHIRILEGLPHLSIPLVMNGSSALRRLGWNAFTDAAIEAMTREVASSWRFSQSLNRQNRERMARHG